MLTRVGRAAAVYAALGVLWWASVRIGWSAYACADRSCLAPTLATAALITLCLLAAAAPALNLVDVRRGRDVALVAAGFLLILGLAGQTLPSWTARPAHAITAATSFAAAGALAGFVTAPETSRRGRVLVSVGMIALIPIALIAVWLRAGL